MDDLDRMILIEDLEAEAAEYDAIEADELARNPEWWNISLGLIEASRQEYDKARSILGQFCKFQPQGVSCVFERFRMFEQAMIMGKVR
jgi:hypothetical protein